MIRKVLVASLVASTSALIFAQSAPPAFEVASIKPAAPQANGRVMVRMGGDAGRVDYTNINLKPVIARAFGVKPHQISGPSWLDSERFDILAKIPEGVPTNQVPAMLQNLLAERFKMVFRRETKDQSVYALVVGKNGPKLTKAAEGEAAPFTGFDRGRGAPPPPPPPGASSGGTAGVRVEGGASGPMAGGRGGPLMISSGGGIQARKTTMTRFSDILSNLLDRPVVDMTKIEGEYDITLEVSPEELRGMRMMRAAVAGPGPAGPGGPAHETGPAPDSAPSASIFSAVQQLGLKLEPRKAPMEFIVIEKADKVPTEN